MQSNGGSISAQYQGDRFVKFGKTKPVPLLTDPSLYLNLDGESSPLVDSSSRKTPIVVTGVTSSSTKAYNGSKSLFFNSNGGITCNIPFTGTDFIIRTWVSWSSTGVNKTLFEIGVYPNGILIRPTSSNYLEIYFGSSVNSVTLIPTLNSWYYFEYSKKGSSHYFYLNGTLIFTGVYVPGNLNTISIGSSAHTTGQYFSGYMDDFQIILGQSFNSSTYAYAPFKNTAWIGLQYNSAIPSLYRDKRPLYNNLGIPDIPNWDSSYQRPKSRPLVTYMKGATHYKVDYNWILAEIQVSVDGVTNLVLDSSNGITFTRLSSVPPNNQGALNNGSLGLGNTEYIGHTNSTESSYQIVFAAARDIKALKVAPQGSGYTVYNNPTMLRISFSVDSGASWIVIQEWTGLNIGSFTPGVLNSFTITNIY
jgi:hypothetical protein